MLVDKAGIWEFSSSADDEFDFVETRSNLILIKQISTRKILESSSDGKVDSSCFTARTFVAKTFETGPLRRQFKAVTIDIKEFDD